MAMIFHEKLHRLMEARGLTYREVAEATGVGTSTVWRWLNQRGKPLRPRLDEAMRLAALLGVGVDFLADDARDEPAPPALSDREQTILSMVRTLAEERGPDEVIRRLMREAPPTHLGHPIIPTVVETLGGKGAAKRPDSGDGSAVHRDNGGRNAG